MAREVDALCFAALLAKGFKHAEEREMFETHSDASELAKVHPMSISFMASGIDRRRLARLADGLAAAVVVTLPWSTSATSILVVLWLIAIIPTINVSLLCREALTLAGGLPIALWVLAAVGTIWAEVSVVERIQGLGGYHKLLMLPLLFAQFRQSDRGHWVLYGFFGSAMVLLAVSWALVLTPGLTWRGNRWGIGIPVKDHILQSGVFVICAFALLDQAFDLVRIRLRLALALTFLAALLFANVFYVATSRTTLVVIPLLLVLLGFRRLGWKGLLGFCIVGGTLSGLMWASSPYLRVRLNQALQEVRDYRSSNSPTSSGLRLEWWKKSIGFVAAAPFVGHGTGSIEDQFRRASTGVAGASAVVTGNPHNQVLAVGVQLGVVGVAVLVALWLAHLAIFRGTGPVAWIGLIVVVQNVISSAFNSHLFDFSQGWLYVFGVGVLGGMVQGTSSRSPVIQPSNQLVETPCRP